MTKEFWLVFDEEDGLRNQAVGGYADFENAKTQAKELALERSRKVMICEVKLTVNRTVEYET